jgi:transglutaminase-like putative cysteine protease
VLDAYQEGVWSPSQPPSEVGETSEKVPGQAENLGGAAGESVIHQNITLLNTPREFSYLFTIWRPAEVRFEDPITCAVHRPHGTLMISGRGGAFRYSARSAPFNANPRRRDARERTGWASPAVRAVAARILAEAEIDPDPARRAIADDSMAVNAFRRYFWANYTYSLGAPPPPRGVDPIDWFLTEGDSGHCEYYASALAALCRSVGIPARVVTGYVAAEYNSTTGHYVVRESNAHAWVEAQVEPGVWKSHDATPPADLLAQHGPAPGLMARAGRALDALNYAWVNSVVSFDSSDRSELLGWSEPLSGAISARIAKLLDAARFAPPKVLVVTAIRVAAAILGGIVAGVVLIRLIRRWRARLAARPRALPRRIADQEIRARIRATPLYQEMLTLLTRRGLHKPAWQPPLAWSGTLQAEFSGTPAIVRELTELYYVMRFGGRDLTAAEQANARRLLSELASSLGREAGESD